MLNFFNVFIKNDIMKNLKILRKSRNLTQKEVANAIGITFQNYSYYETGRTKPTPEMLCTLADFFGVTVDELLGRTPQLFDDARVPKTEVQELFDQLTAHQKDLVLERMRAYIDANNELKERQQYSPIHFIQRENALHND